MTEDGNADSVFLIDFDSGKVVCDQLVKPPSPITDYLTGLGGLTAAAIDHVATTLADVKCAHKAFDDLLGHSLESYLHSLLLVHPRGIDTATLPPPAHSTSRAGPGIYRRPGRNDPKEDARFVHTVY
ncbi:hypothetical protein EDB86DRAFT_2838758 [Lactarius hatsudake]|nr:hypothetical protein EDB86DRAFT_2838758 [Lactarius hatsudake]